ncbi:unnamed protein product [Dibothriocephalus latus]|uniref:Exoribonuclease Xrn1 D2/D3 domain-containing protein n=1 Tax=Dibothriocephalus latus TaxID=60516 RepID=A0A3P7Q2J6_DIBLA|nr:unnamed protein product [Dibothriocephalus latus]
MFRIQLGEHPTIQPCVASLSSMRSRFAYAQVLPELFSEADEQDYLTNKELADRLHLQPPVVAALTDDVMIRAPQFDNDKEGNRRVINVGLAIRPHNSRANTIGWSRFSATRGMWLFSQRVLDVLRKYAELFPELTNYLSGWNCRGVADSNHIFPQDTL